MTSQPEALNELESAFGRVRQQLAAMQEQIAELTRENEQLKADKQRLAAERDGYYRWYVEQLREECRKYPEAVEAEILEGIKNGADFTAFVREMETELQHDAV